MSAQIPTDPAFFSKRACNGVNQDVFFPSAQQQARVRRAQEICVGCPVLAECATWARPLVIKGALAGCVVGGVYAPHRATRQQTRDAAVAQLGVVARLAAARERDDVEGAA
ncbi:WhiB family transcriptional regulator [Nocardia xishanensis]|uniref:WhiB family transcriptional regulator n=1 Tax=Nocardia xishanensis TaxID=238964 RepID=UPI00340284A8